MAAVALFLHVLAAMGLFSGFALELVLVVRVRHATARDELARLLGEHARLGRLYAPSALLILLSGVYLTFAANAWGAGWPAAGLLGLVLLGLMGGLVTGSTARRLARALPSHADGVDPAGRSLVRSVWHRIWIAVGILFVMTVQPPGPAGFIAIAAAVALGWATAPVTARFGS